MTTEELKVFRQEKLDDFIDDNLESIKARAGYMTEVTAFDQEIKTLMSSAVMDMLTAGVPEALFEVTGSGEEVSLDARILNAISLYVQAYIEQDRTDTRLYLDLFKRITFKLSLEDGGGWDDESHD